MDARFDADWRTAYACGALRIAETLAVALSNTPLLRLLEFNMCQHYYRQHDPENVSMGKNVPEALCKGPNVQSTISNLTGTDSVLLFIPSLLAALHYMLPRRQMRKRRTLLINILGNLSMNAYHVIVLSLDRVLDPRWIWLRGIFSFVGGGDLVFYSISQALIAESLPHKRLSTFYLYNTALASTVKIIGSISSLTIMNISIWLPIALSFVVKSMTLLVVVFFIPELSIHHKDDHTDSFELLANHEMDLTDNQLDHDQSSEPSHLGQCRLHERFSTISRYRRPLGVCTLQEAGLSYRYIVPYWLSRRYGWTLQETGWIFMGEMLLTALVVAVQPRWLKHTHQGSDQERDLGLAKVCLGFSTCGTLLLGLTWYKVSAVVCLGVIAGGTPFRDAYMAHLTAKLQRQEIADVYIVLSVIQLAAFSLGAWTVASLDAMFLRLGSAWWTSTPIWLCSLAFASAAWLAG